MEENKFIKKLEGRELVYIHAVSNKVNEIIDVLNEAILSEEMEKGEKQDGNISS